MLNVSQTVTLYAKISEDCLSRMRDNTLEVGSVVREWSADAMSTSSVTRTRSPSAGGLSNSVQGGGQTGTGPPVTGETS